jgi:hypothetical protein
VETTLVSAQSKREHVQATHQRYRRAMRPEKRLILDEFCKGTMWCIPMGSWELEGGSPPGTVIATLRTPDGFEVSFALAALELLRMANPGANASAEASGVINN